MAKQCVVNRDAEGNITSVIVPNFSNLSSENSDSLLNSLFEQNSDLKNIGNIDEYQEYLKNVFPESKIKNAVYHTTDNEFDSLEKNPNIEGYKTNTAGIHFIEEIAVEDYKKAFGKTVRGAMVDFRNPLYTDYDSTDENHTSQKLEYLQQSAIDEFKSQGYDSGIIYRDGDTEFIAFENEQVHTLGSKKDVEGFQNYKNVRFSISNEGSSSIPEDAIERVINRLLENSIVDNVRLVDQAEFSNIVADLNVKQIGVEKARGFYNSTTREIVLNRASPDLLNTALHEFSHPFLQTLRDVRPDIYNAGLNVLKTNYESVQPYIDSVRLNYPTLAENSDEFMEEVLANIIADRGVKLIDRMNKQNVIRTWLSTFWAFIKRTLGISTYTTERIEDMTLNEFSYAIFSEMLNGGFTRYSISALQRPEFTELRGRRINPVTIQNLAKGKGIKQIEKDIINSVLELDIFKTKKIDYDTFEKAIQANVMPLTKVESDTHAEYGRLEGMKYDSYKSMVYNSPLDHGLTGHFGSVYGETNYGEEEDDTEGEDRNKGLFGHTRVWTKGDTFYIAEVQSDAFQKTTVEDNSERKRRQDYEQQLEDHKITQGNSMVKLMEGAGYKFVTKGDTTSVYKPLNQFGLPMGDTTGIEIAETPNGKVISVNGELKTSSYFLDNETIQKRIDYYANTEGSFKDGEPVSLEDVADNLKDDYKYVTEGYYTELKKIRDAYEKATPSFVKQFNASDKIFELRLIRESIKEAALRGFETLRLPTAYTISVIEGYIGGEGQGELLDNDYPVVGERVRYLGNQREILEVLSADEVRIGDSLADEARSARLDMLTLFDKTYDTYEDFRNDVINNSEYYDAFQYFDNAYLGHEGTFKLSEAPNLEAVTETYLENTPRQRNWGSEIISLNSVQVRPENFTLDYLLDSHKPIARRYEEFGDMLKQERGDNFRLVKDEAGNPWYETDITEEDVINPVLAFQIGDNIEVMEKDTMPSQLYEALSQQPFLNKEQALEAYKNIYSDNLNGWQNKELDC